MLNAAANGHPTIGFTTSTLVLVESGTHVSASIVSIGSEHVNCNQASVPRKIRKRCSVRYFVG